MTYTIGTKGISGHQLFAVTTLTLADDHAAIGSQKKDMQTGSIFLCQRPDGSQGYFMHDPYRSTPGNPVLIKAF